MAVGTTVEVTINEDGVASVHVVGGKGTSCKKHLEAFKNLGNTIEEGKKAEYFRPEEAGNLTFNTTSVKNG